jgi:uncharacterized protein (TIGR03067 family)
MKAVIAVLAVALVAGGDKPDPAKADKEKMQGTWTMTESLRDGEEAIPEEDRKELRLTIKDNKRTIKVRDEVVSEATYTLDATTKPKGITIKVDTGPLKDKELPGIYELDGDKLKICLNLTGKDRPKEFKSENGSGTLLQVFQRVKDDKKDK